LPDPVSEGRLMAKHTRSRLRYGPNPEPLDILPGDLEELTRETYPEWSKKMMIKGSQNMK